MIKQMLDYPFPLPGYEPDDISRLSTETLRRHAATCSVRQEVRRVGRIPTGTSTPGKVRVMNHDTEQHIFHGEIIPPDFIQWMRVCDLHQEFEELAKKYGYQQAKRLWLEILEEHEVD